MSTEKKSVHLTSSNLENFSRNDMLAWINETLSSNYSKIEQLCSGVAYCQLMEILFPGSVGIKKLKTNAKLDYEYIFNLKLFQNAFTKLQIEKSVPIDRLIKGRFQDNFEFLQWFKKFYDTYSTNKENTGAIAQNSSEKKILKKSTSTPSLKFSSCPLSQSKKTTSALLKVNINQNNCSPTISSSTRPVSPGTIQVLTEDANLLKEKVSELEEERNFYYNKLQKIEALCEENVNSSESSEWAKKVLAALYATETKENLTKDGAEELK